MIHFKNRGANRFECWIEEWIDNDWKVVAESNGFIAADTFLIDRINTESKFRRKGYASQIVNKLLSTGNKVAPIGIISTNEAQSFWKKFNMTDALGPEDYMFEDSDGIVLDGKIREVANQSDKVVQIKDGNIVRMLNVDEVKLLKQSSK